MVVVVAGRGHGVGLVGMGYAWDGVGWDGMGYGTGSGTMPDVGEGNDADPGNVDDSHQVTYIGSSYAVVYAARVSLVASSSPPHSLHKASS